MKTSNTILSKVDTLDGSYSFCSLCRKDGNCCVRVSPGGSIGNPLLLSDDVERIERHVGIPRDTFSSGSDHIEHGIRVMKSDSNGCHFCKNGNCAIYPVRPLDCRLFPIDIMEKSNGAVVWIAYTATCPVAFDVAACLNQAKNLLPQLQGQILEYARANAPWMSGEPFVELGPVDFVEAPIVADRTV